MIESFFQYFVLGAVACAIGMFFGRRDVDRVRSEMNLLHSEDLKRVRQINEIEKTRLRESLERDIDRERQRIQSEHHRERAHIDDQHALLAVQSKVLESSSLMVAAAGDRCLAAAAEVMKKARDQEGVVEHMKASNDRYEKLAGTVESLDRIVGSLANWMVNSGIVREFRTGSSRDDVQVGQKPITRKVPEPGERPDDDFDRPL